MLSQLSIKNVAVIDKLDVDINNGVTVLTGETGAGKSIIIDSINMILGERTNKDIVRYGTDRATVQAVFTNIPKNVLDTLLEYDIECEDDIIISRTVTKDGKSTARINGVIVPISVLREISNALINIHGQHDNQALLTAKKHIDFLDAYADCDELIAEYKKIYSDMKELKSQINKLLTNEADKEHRMDLLSYQINEIEQAKLTAGEDVDLEEQREIISNAEKINTAVEIAYTNLYDNPNAQSAYDSLSIAVSSLEGISDINQELKDAYDALCSAMYTTEDVSHIIKNFGDSVEFSEAELNDIEERLDLISKLKRKYGATIPEILEFLDKAKAELSQFEKGDELLSELNKKLGDTENALKKIGEELSMRRYYKAEELSKKITTALSELNMEKAVVSISVINNGEFYDNGMDTVEFMIRTNPGEPLKPLAKIASGGELSRVILAIKSILANTDSVDTMIFDEIDTGVSGAAAAKITQKLVSIGKNKQVICITHLPQLAAAAATHYLIVKDVSGDMASTTLKELSQTEREQELARIIDGINITDIALSHAKEMLKNAQAYNV